MLCAKYCEDWLSCAREILKKRWKDFLQTIQNVGNSVNIYNRLNAQQFNLRDTVIYSKYRVIDIVKISVEL